MRVSSIEFYQKAIPSEELPQEVLELIDLAEAMEIAYVIEESYRSRWVCDFIVTGKGRNSRPKTRYAILDHDACLALKAYLDSRPANAPDDLWLCENSNKPVSVDALYHAFKRVADDAGVDCSPHDLRHTFAHRYLSAGVDVKTVADFLGHTDPMTTLRIYHKNRLSDLREKYAEMARNGYY